MKNSYREMVNDFWRAARPLFQALPLTLSNGSQVEALNSICSRCKSPVFPSMLRGGIRPSLYGYRITAFGYCPLCNLLTPYMCEVVETKDSFKIEQTKFKGWKKGEVVFVDFHKERDKK